MFLPSVVTPRMISSVKGGGVCLYPLTTLAAALLTQGQMYT